MPSRAAKMDESLIIAIIFARLKIFSAFFPGRMSSTSQAIKSAPARQAKA